MSNYRFSNGNEKAFYEALIQNDINFVDKFINENVKHKEYVIREGKFLLDIYSDIKIKRINLSAEIEEKLLECVVKSYFIKNETEVQNSNFTATDDDQEIFIQNFDNIQSRVILLVEELNKNHLINNQFLFLCSQIANSIYSLKKICKFLSSENKLGKSFFYLILPWEQIQFILTTLVLSYEKNFMEETVLYPCIITREVLMDYLISFVKDLKKLKIDEILNNKKELPIIDKDDYSNLFRDFWMIKNIYSLRLINDTIELAVSLDYDQDIDYASLAMFRCLLIIGEYTKCTPESPHMSEELQYLLADLSPRDLQLSTKKIRNDLSHFFNATTIKKEIFLGVQKDLIKIVNSFHYAFKKAKYSLIQHFFNSITRLDNSKQVFDCIPQPIFNSLTNFLERYTVDLDTIDFSSLQTTIKQLKNEISSDKVQQFYSLDEYIRKNNIDYKTLDYKSIIKIREASKQMLENGSTNESNKLLEALHEIETLTLFHQFHIASLKISLKALTYLISVLNIPLNGRNQLIIENIKNVVLNLPQFPYNNIIMLRHIKDYIDFIGKKIQDNEIAVSIVEFLHTDKYQLKILEEIKYMNTLWKNQLNKLDFITSKSEVEDIFKLIRVNLLNKYKDCITKFDETLDQEISEYNRINQLIDTIQKLVEEKDKEIHNEIEKAKDLIGNKNNELDLAMLNALENKDFTLCFDIVKKKHKGKRKCKYENLIRGFSKEENSNLDNKIKLINEFLKTVDSSGKIKEIVKDVILTKYLLKLEETYRILEKNCNILIQGINDKRIKLKLQAASEMALLQILEQAHKYGGGEKTSPLFSLRPDTLLVCGKSLRNYLAHCDISYKTLVFKPDIIMPLISFEINKNGVMKIPNQNYFIRKDTILDLTVEENCMKQSKSIVYLQNELFDAIEKDELEEMMKLIEIGADPRGTDVYHRNALQLAFYKNSIHCFLHLIFKYKPIKIAVQENETKNSTNNVFQFTIKQSEDINFIHTINNIIPFLAEKCMPQIKTNQNSLKGTFINIYNALNECFTMASRFNSNKSSWINLLHIAICGSIADINWFRTIIQDEKTNLNVEDLFNNTPLHWAVVLGLENVCQLLIERGANLKQTNCNGHTPLDLAIIGRQWKIINSLLQNGLTFNFTRNPVYINILNEDNFERYVNIYQFFDAGKQFRIIEFCYAIFIVNVQTRENLINLVQNVEDKIEIQFSFAKTKLLDKEEFEMLVLGFLLSCACMFNRKDIVESILSKGSQYSMKDIDHYIGPVSDHMIYEIFQTLSYFKLACLEGNQNIIEYLIEHKVDINEKDEQFGLMPIHISVMKSKGKTLEYLIQHDADLNAGSSIGLTPFHVASLTGNIKMTEILCLNKANVNTVTNYFHHTALHLATQRGFESLVRIIMNVDNKSANYSDKFGNTPLHMAAYFNHKNIVEILLENHCSVDATNNNNLTAIHYAVLGGNIEVLKMIINKLSPVNKSSIINMKMKNDNFNKHVIDSWGRGYKEVADNYTSLTAVAYGSTALHVAALRGHNDMVNTLIKNIAEIECISDEGFTPLHLAVKEGHMNVVLTLLSNSSYPHVKDKSENTLLHKAAHYNHPSIVNALLDNVIDQNYIDEKNKGGYTALHMAALRGYTEVFHILVERGANINAKSTESGYTALHLAAESGHVGIVQSLIDRGASVNTLSYDFKTPLDRVIDCCHGGIAEPIDSTLLKVIQILIDNNAWTDVTGGYFGESLLHNALTCSDITGARVLLELTSEKTNFQFPQRLNKLKEKRHYNAIKSFTLDDLPSKLSRIKHLQNLSYHYIRRKSLQDHLIYLMKKDIKSNKKFVDVSNGTGTTALHWTANVGIINEAELLISHGADINSQNIMGLTPLHIAVQEENESFVSLLLNKHADINIPCNYGLTPLAMAIYYERKNIIKIIEEHKRANEK